MRNLLSFLGIALLSGCAVFQGGQVDLDRLATEIMLVRQDVMGVLPAASPETQARVAELMPAIERVEEALRFAAAGGPVGDITEAARIALTLADQIVASLPPEQQGDLRFYIGLLQIPIRHLAAAEFQEAEEALAEEPPAPEVPAAQ